LNWILRAKVSRLTAVSQGSIPTFCSSPLRVNLDQGLFVAHLEQNQLLLCSNERLAAAIRFNDTPGMVSAIFTAFENPDANTGLGQS
jgi:hypothetical protein